MGIFEKLGPELTDEHLSLRRRGIAAQRDGLQELVVRYGGLISSAVRSEMVTTNCTYETACSRLVQECDRFIANMYYCDLAEQNEAIEALPEGDQ